MTQISNHNGKISNEASMVTAIQWDSGYPIMFRAVPGNIVDVTTLSTTITTLAEYDVQTDLAMLDAGYVSLENMKSLFFGWYRICCTSSRKEQGYLQQRSG